MRGHVVSVACATRSTTPLDRFAALERRMLRAICATDGSASVTADTCGVTVDPRMMPERVCGRQRLLAEHVERRRREMSAVERVERGRRRRRSRRAPTLTRCAPRGSCARSAGVDDAARRRRQRHEAHQHLRAGEECAAAPQRPRASSRRRRACARRATSRHAESPIATTRPRRAPSTPMPSTPTPNSSLRRQRRAAPSAPRAAASA